MKRYTVTNIQFNTKDFVIPKDMTAMFEYAKEYNRDLETIGQVFDMYIRTTLAMFRINHMRFSGSESILNKPTMLKHSEQYIHAMADYDADEYVEVELTVEHPTKFAIVVEDPNDYNEISDAIKLHMADHMKLKYQYKIK